MKYTENGVKCVEKGVKCTENGMKYTENGVTNIKFTLHPEYKLNIPLDIIFKLIHATDKVPLIKYNPSKRLENQYRLYTSDKISESGEKIPFLEKAQINHEIVKRGNNNSVMAYLNIPKYKNPMYCYFGFLCQRFKKTGSSFRYDIDS